MAYTDEQIAKACANVTEALKGLTDTNVKAFLSTPIIKGMKANKTIDEITADCYDAIKPISPLNIMQIVSGTLSTTFASFSTSEEPEEETVTITSVTLDKNTLTITKGTSETLTATVVASPDEAKNKNVTWSLSVTDDKISVKDGVVTVNNDATSNEVTVTATSTVDNTKSDSCVITIVES